MSTASVLLAADEPALAAPPYALLISRDPGIVEEAQQLRYDVFTSELRLGAKICGQPAHDTDFAVADFPALLDKRNADIRYLERLRSAAKIADGSQ